MCIRDSLYKVYKEEFIKVAERQLRGKTADGGAVLSYIRSFESSMSPQRAPVTQQQQQPQQHDAPPTNTSSCLLYTSDAADDLLCVDLGGRRIIKKKKNI
eukprot:TRINITY_DN3972_c0_g1_i1.p1 TRINITY_DN3972_c0_g1~~TRINITY_DN3972_c0_g1_i1.p1  ORF type:complete len:100 (+),score=49.27 TRINITY_DN3972_c0_g1_i1:117-416(+)